MANGYKTQKKMGFFGASHGTPKVSLAIDYPKERDVVLPGHYAVRVSGGAGSLPEVSINGGEWKACRFAEGFHWFDWFPAQKGTCKILARARSGTDAWVTSAERSCTVTPPKTR